MHLSHHTHDATWEVVDHREIEQVPSYYDESFVQISSISSREITQTYTFDSPSSSSHHHHAGPSSPTHRNKLLKVPASPGGFHRLGFRMGSSRSSSLASPDTSDSEEDPDLYFADSSDRFRDPRDFTPSQARDALVSARNQLLASSELRKLGGNVLFSEGYLITKLRKGNRYRMQIQYTARPAKAITRNGAPKSLLAGSPPFMDLLEGSWFRATPPPLFCVCELQVAKGKSTVMSASHQTILPARDTTPTPERTHRADGQRRLADFIRQAHAPPIPQQIHELGLMPLFESMPHHVPPREAARDKDFEQIMNFLHPAMCHLIRPNTVSPLHEPAQNARPFLHPQYAEAFWLIITKLQPHTVDPLTLNLLECGEELYRRLDAFFSFTVREWYELILQVSEASRGTEQNGYGGRVLDLYRRAYQHFNEGAHTIDYLCTCFNEHYVIMRDLATGGYHWLSEYERAYVNEAGRKRGVGRRTERVNELLVKWGYRPRDPVQGPMDRSAALLCALASTNERVVVPVAQLGLKRWRVGLIEPLFARGVFGDVVDYIGTVAMEREGKKMMVLEVTAGLRQCGVDPFHYVIQDLEELII
ncbi:hypothetical protein FRB98_007606 [Tulasnella sp. 332]|nr:hypothetical protein FRB98_007606 [Tulasnella sp. 332]